MTRARPWIAAAAMSAMPAAAQTLPAEFAAAGNGN